jgi:uncharacterized circularly permuted ATP-grasp superfamily protein
VDKPECYDEMRAPDGTVREAYAAIDQWLTTTPRDFVASRQLEAEQFFRRIGITFNVYGDAAGAERLIPFDIIPRVLTAGEWHTLERGLEQRVKALNAFIRDVYGSQEIIAAGVVPQELVLQNPAFQPAMMRIRPPGDVYVHVAGIDIVRVDPETFYVLEDNARTPSGVSYMLETERRPCACCLICSASIGCSLSTTIPICCWPHSVRSHLGVRPASRRSFC